MVNLTLADAKALGLVDCIMILREWGVMVWWFYLEEVATICQEYILFNLLNAYLKVDQEVDHFQLLVGTLRLLVGEGHHLLILRLDSLQWVVQYFHSSCILHSSSPGLDLINSSSSRAHHCYTCSSDDWSTMRRVGTSRTLDDWEPLIALVHIPLHRKQCRIVILISLFVAPWVCSILQEFGALLICCWYIMKLLTKEMLRLLLCWSLCLPEGLSCAALLLVRKVFALGLHVGGSSISSKEGLWLWRWTKFTYWNSLLILSSIIRVLGTLLWRKQISSFKISWAQGMILSAYIKKTLSSFWLALVKNLNFLLIFGAKRFNRDLLVSWSHHHPLMIEILNFVLHSMLILVQLCHIVAIVLLLVEIEGLDSAGARWLSLCHSSTSFLSIGS